VTTHLRNGTTVEDPRLDRLPSARTDHLEKYPLTAATLPSQATPVQAGFNVYRWLMDPDRMRVNGRIRWVVGNVASSSWGRVIGGHAVALRPWRTTDAYSWWPYYDQQNEGRCPEFSALRVLSLLNRKRYDITSRWHYWQMQRIDEWAGGSYPDADPFYEGSSVRAALEVLRQYGAIPALPSGYSYTNEKTAQAAVKPAEGIAAYRWCLTWQMVRTVLGVPDDLPGVPLLNSWGKSFPREVLLLDDAGERLLREDGEFGTVVDR
jgi:hypothetical protein